jgi:arginine decarboxylase
MPGHKLGRGIPAEFQLNPTMLDLTEIPGMDDLHFPKEAIRDAQELAAKAFGAQKTYFLVNGSTCGIHASILAVCRPGDKLIVSRDSHKSVITGMMLAGVSPIYIKPHFEKQFEISGIAETDEIEKALRENSDAVGVLITRPNYYGICADLQSIVDITHSYGKIVIVDEAHGAHLHFNKSLPESAMKAGADISIQSAHKTLPAFTQGAYLHINPGRIDLDRLEFYLSSIQTSSPSYIIMTYLDIARAIMEKDGKRLLDTLLESIDWFKDSMRNAEGISVLSEKLIMMGKLDKTRLVINTKNIGKTGFEVERILRQEHNIQVEMSDINNIVCIATVADTKKDFESLSFAVNKLASRFKGLPPLADIMVRDMVIPKQGAALNEIRHGKAFKLKFKESCGRTSMSIITPYPPGIPAICPGEVISQDAIEYVNSIIALGGKVTGLSGDGEISIVL